MRNHETRDFSVVSMIREPAPGRSGHAREKASVTPLFSPALTDDEIEEMAREPINPFEARMTLSMLALSGSELLSKADALRAIDCSAGRTGLDQIAECIESFLDRAAELHRLGEIAKQRLDMVKSIDP
jgi:hypothetical protein